jgi:competence protein ComEA
VAPPAWVDRLRAWLAWFGIGRVVAAGLATVIVCVGAFWLVRAPMPPTETSLPVASTAASSSAAVGASPTSAPPVERVLVHVAGAVAEPGVYDLAPGARVRDAVVAAGGPTADADWNALNLAAVVSDASRVYVPVVGEDVPPDVLGGSGAATANGPVDVNRATVDELDELPGIGPATATAIVTERERNGPFVDVDDLDRVPGIGPAKLDALRDLVTT